MRAFPILLPILLALGLAAGSAFAREVPGPLPHSDPALFGLNGISATLFSNLTSLPHEEFRSRDREFTLEDGTRLKGLLFPYETEASEPPAPLLIVNFGAMTDRWNPGATAFVRELVLTRRLHANVLIVDNISSGAFFTLNQNLSLGGYDEGRVFIQLAERLRADGPAFSTIHLMGVSLGGLAVLQAMIEDARLGTHLFASAITFSAVVDQASITEAVMGGFGHPFRDPRGATLTRQGKVLLSFGIRRINAALLEAGAQLRVSPSGAGDFFYEQTERRLQSLRSSPAAQARWNPAVSLASVEDYVRTSSALLERTDTLQAPITLLHAKNDPVVPYSQFRAFARRESATPLILTHSTRFGGHWGFSATYGTQWIQEWIEKALTTD